ncbi:hypothetical protein FA95DRAFT_1557118 [Auriscalpium vulgare]|uniref:Uncharacterized protein n=1 Tax=Auriscalpium vulgare TaxID=40419 RepID=A0ACB8RZM9_9AGAM|nr:hypothetical protein FA95DRAFT_1557118 [Auriscalpium vulgare]
MSSHAYTDPHHARQRSRTYDAGHPSAPQYNQHAMYSGSQSQPQTPYTSAPHHTNASSHYGGGHPSQQNLYGSGAQQNAYAQQMGSHPYSGQPTSHASQQASHANQQASHASQQSSHVNRQPTYAHQQTAYATQPSYTAQQTPYAAQQSYHANPQTQYESYQSSSAANGTGLWFLSACRQLVLNLVSRLRHGVPATATATPATPAAAADGVIQRTSIRHHTRLRGTSALVWPPCAL